MIDTDSKRAKVVEKVRGLLAKAASTEHEAEQAAFQAKATELITQYQIEQAELRDRDDTIDRTVVTYDDWGNATKGIGRIYGNLAALFGCATGQWTGQRGSLVTDPDTGRTEWNERNTIDVHIWGSKADIDLLVMFVDALLPQLRADLLRDRPRSRKSYVYGWAAVVGKRAEETHQQTWEASDTTALVPTASKAESARDDACGKSRRESIDGTSYGQGEAAGSNADLGGAKVSA